jgi:hypothetical protein
MDKPKRLLGGVMAAKTTRVLAVLALAASGLLAAAGPAAASSTPQCTRAYTYYGEGYYEQYPAGWNATYSYWAMECWLASGSSNGGVRQLQSDLNNCYGRTSWGGVDLGIRLTVDGDFGPKTKAALTTAQRYLHDHGRTWLTVDGIYGPQSADTMNHVGAWSGVGYRCWHYEGPVLQ